jgi:hypothetical protein
MKISRAALVVGALLSLAAATAPQEVGPGGSTLSLGAGTFAITPAPVPLPPSVWMLILCLGGLGVVSRMTKKSESAGFLAA